jgi:predicted ArsR family transcriptional regulator
MADAIADTARTGTPILDALSYAAGVRGAALAESATDRPSSADAAFDLAVRILTEYGYEPRRIDSTVIMANCPFHALAVGHTELVCRLNHSLLTKFVGSIAPDLLNARLQPDKNRCCVTLAAFERSGER